MLMNTAIAEAETRKKMAMAMKLGVEAGRLAFLAGRMPKKLYASASSPLAGGALNSDKKTGSHRPDRRINRPRSHGNHRHSGARPHERVRAPTWPSALTQLRLREDYVDQTPARRWQPFPIASST